MFINLVPLERSTCTRNTIMHPLLTRRLNRREKGIDKLSEQGMIEMAPLEKSDSLKVVQYIQCMHIFYRSMVDKPIR